MPFSFMVVAFSSFLTNAAFSFAETLLSKYSIVALPKCPVDPVINIFHFLIFKLF